MALRMGVQLGAFKMIADNPTQGTTSQQIAEKSGASMILVGKSRPFCTSPYLPMHADSSPMRVKLVKMDRRYFQGPWSHSDLVDL